MQTCSHQLSHSTLCLAVFQQLLLHSTLTPGPLPVVRQHVKMWPWKITLLMETSTSMTTSTLDGSMTTLSKGPEEIDYCRTIHGYIRRFGNLWLPSSVIIQYKGRCVNTDADRWWEVTWDKGSHASQLLTTFHIVGSIEKLHMQWPLPFWSIILILKYRSWKWSQGRAASLRAILLQAPLVRKWRLLTSTITYFRQSFSGS